MNMMLLISLEDERSIKEYKNLSELKLYNFDSRYVCDRAGKVYRVKKLIDGTEIGIEMKPFLTYDGYVEYVLTSKYGKKHIQAQRIVAGLYIPKPRGKDFVNHKNLNRKDNRVENLEWVTHSENVKHSWDNNKNRKS